MPTNSRLIADAKRAAKAFVRERAGGDTPITYQQALDVVARRAGRAHWSAFLANPASVATQKPNMATTTKAKFEQSKISALHQAFGPGFGRSATSHLPEIYKDAVFDHSTLGKTTILRKLADGRIVSESNAELDNLVSRNVVTISDKLGILARLTGSKAKPALSNGTTLGRLHDGQLLALAPGLSTLCIAPTGAGKTSGLIIPHVLLADDQSLIIHDPKGEIRAQTAPHRSSLGPVHVIDWNAPSDPANPQSACINLLGPDMLPPPGSKRTWYIKELAKALILPTNPDKYFADQARIMLAGLIDLFVAIAEIPDCPVELIEGPIPQPSLPSVTATIEQFIEIFSDKFCVGTGFVAIRETFGPYLGNPTPLAEALNRFNTMEPKTCETVFQTVRQALRPFSNPAVISRTMHSTFHPRDFRGVKGLPKSHKPVTLYLSSPMMAPAAERLNALILAMLALHHSSHGPSETDFGDVRNGLLAVSYVLDEFAHIGRVPNIRHLTELGPIQKASLHIFTQHASQIINIYGHDWFEGLKGNTSCELALEQNYPDGHGLHFKRGQHGAIISATTTGNAATLIDLQTLQPWVAPELKNRWTNPRQM